MVATKRNTPLLRVLGLIVVAWAAALPLLGQGFCGVPVPPPNPPQDPPGPACAIGSGGPAGWGLDLLGALGQVAECNLCKGSPCYVGSGVYETYASDLEIPTTGFGLRVERGYESARAIDGPLGKGWTSNLTPRLYYTTYLLAAPNTVQRQAAVTMPSGRRHTFIENGDGTFAPPVGSHDALARNADSSFDLRPSGTMSRYHFAADGSLSSATDDYGNRIVYSYDANGRLERVADDAGSGRYLDVFWGADGRISTVRDHTGREIGYTYNGQGALATASDPLSRDTSYGYFQGRYAPLLATVTDHWGRTVTNVTYDSKDRVASYTEEGETWIYTYAYQGNPLKTAKVDSQGKTWVFTFLASGLVTDRVPPANSGGGPQHTDYYPDGSPQMRVDEVGVKTYFTYDTAGNVLSRTDDYQGPHAVRYDYAYDPAFPGRVISVTPRNPATGQVDPSWQAWRYDYYQAGSPAPGALFHVYRVQSDGSTLDTLATYTYDSRGRTLSVTDAGGATADYGYDGQGNLASVTRPANNDAGVRPVTTYGSDALGRVVTVTDPLGSETTYGYDAVGRVETLSLPPPVPGSPLDFTTTYSYDNFDVASGLVFTRITDPNGNVTQQGENAHSRLVEGIDALSGVTRWAYTRGLLSSVTDPNGNLITYTYNGLRRLTAATFADGAQDLFAYYPDGRLQTKTDRKNQTVSYTYDHFKRVSAKTYPNATSITYTYTGQSLTGIADSTLSPAETHAFTYDQRYQRATETQGARATLTYTYTATGERSSYQVGGSAGASYTYYSDGSLDTIEWTAVSGEFKHTYDLRGQYQQVLFPNGQHRDYNHDGMGRLLEIANFDPASANLATYIYGYDVDNSTAQPEMLGQRTSMTADVPVQGLAAAAAKYYYDGNYQLVRADYPAAAPFLGEVAAWTYDGIGNRLSSAVNGATATFTYQKIGANPNAWQRLISDGTNSYSYDPNGGIAAHSGSTSSHTFTWSYDHRLSAIAGSAAATYSYDYQGRRIGKTAGAVTTNYVYESQNLIAELGASPAEYLFGPGIDEPLAMSKGGQVAYFAVDGLGSVVATSDASGNVTHSVVFDAWGNAKSETGARNHPFTYTGREVGEADLLFYRARYYDSRIGRFTQEDEHSWYEPGTGRYASPDPEDLVSPLPPSRFAGLSPVIAPYPVQVGQLNLLYGYVAQKPLEFGDPSGGGILKPIRCTYFTVRCILATSECRDFYRRCFEKLSADDDYEKINQMLARARVSSTSAFIYKVCISEDEDCRKVLDLGCPNVPFKPY